MKWTPITMRGNENNFPTKQGKYIVTYISQSGQRRVEERWFYSGNIQGWTKGRGRIIAWMPMPEPYRGGNL